MQVTFFTLRSQNFAKNPVIFFQFAMCSSCIEKTFFTNAVQLELGQSKKNESNLGKQFENYIELKNTSIATNIDVIHESRDRKTSNPNTEENQIAKQLN